MSGLLEHAPALWQGLLVTIGVALASIAGAALGAVVLGGLRLARSRAVRAGAVLLIELIRGASALVLLFWVFYALPLVPGMPHLGPLTAAILVLAAIGASYGSEIVRSGIEAVPRGQRDACHALGLTRVQAFRHVVMPQALSQIVPAFGSLAADMIKWTSIVSFVGVQDVLYVANAIRSLTYETVTVFGLLALLYWMLCLASSLAFRALERVLPLNRAMRATGGSGQAGGRVLAEGRG